MAPDPATAVRHLFVVHGLASAFTLIGFLLVGVAPLDAVLLAMATASTYSPGGVHADGDMVGLRVVVTAGPTREA